MNTQLLIPGFPEPRKKQVYSGPTTFKMRQSKEDRPTLLTKMISISPSYFTLFNDVSGFSRSSKFLKATPPPKVSRVTDTGTMSRSAASKMKRAIEYISLISQEKKVRNVAKGYEFTFKLSFITLTLSDVQKHSDSYIKTKMLKAFIDNLRRRYPAISYVWKAETQNNGRLHFHIITDHFIPTSYINYRWNKIQWNHGYLHKYLNKNHHLNAPSAEIRKVKNDKELAKYMRKYMLKNIEKLSTAEIHQKIDSLKNRIAFCQDPHLCTKMSQELIPLYRKLNESKKRKVKGKLWGCSDNLLLKPYVSQFDGFDYHEQAHLNSHKEIKDGYYFRVFKIDSLREFLLGFGPQVSNFIFDYYRQLIHPIKIPVMVYSTEKNYRYN